MSYAHVSHKFPVTSEQVEQWENLEEKIIETSHRHGEAIEAKVEFLRSIVPQELKDEYGTRIDYYGSEIIKQQLFLSTYPRHQ